MFDADKDDTPGKPSIDQTLEYIADMLLSLEQMARRSDLERLAGIIDLARHEAQHRKRPG